MKYIFVLMVGGIIAGCYGCSSSNHNNNLKIGNVENNNTVFQKDFSTYRIYPEGVSWSNKINIFNTENKSTIQTSLPGDRPNTGGYITWSNDIIGLHFNEEGKTYIAAYYDNNNGKPDMNYSLFEISVSGYVAKLGKLGNISNGSLFIDIQNSIIQYIISSTNQLHQYNILTKENKVITDNSKEYQSYKKALVSGYNGSISFEDGMICGNDCKIFIHGKAYKDTKQNRSIGGLIDYNLLWGYTLPTNGSKIKYELIPLDNLSLIK